MVEIRTQKVGPSDCRSLGSNQHQSGRSAKISIGITVEKSPTVVSEVGKKDAPALHSAEKLSSYRRVVGNQSRPHDALNLETTKVEIKGQKNSECLTSRSSCRKASNADTGKFYVNHAPVLPSVDSTHKKVDVLAHEHNGEEDGDAYVDQGLALATMQKTNILDQELSREPPGEVDKSTTDGLKLKLWEILGGVPSQKEHNMNSQKLDENKKNIDVDHNRGLQKGRAAKPKPSSDPIETDSDSHNQTIKRPATRSMTRKKTPNKLVKNLDDALHTGKKLLSSTCLDYKHKAEENIKGRDNEKKKKSFGIEENLRMPDKNAYEKSEAGIEFRKTSRSSSDNNHNVQTNFKSNDKEDIFSFAEEGNKRTLEKIASAQSKRLNEKTKATIEMTINLPSRSSSKSILQKNEDKLFRSPAKGLQRMNDIVTSPSLTRTGKKQSMQLKNALNGSQNSQINAQNLSGITLVPKVVAYENAQSSLPKKEKGSWEHVNNSSMSKLVFQHDKAVCSPMTSSVDASDDLQSPTLAGNVTPVTPSRPSNEISGSPLRTRKINFTWNLNNSDIMDNDKPESCGSEANTESSDDTREVYESRDLESTFVDGNETKEQLPLSPITGHDSDSFGAKELKIKEVRQTSKWFPSVDKSDKSPFKLHKRRRVHGLKDAKLNEGDETNDLHEASGQCIEDGLARAVNQLALALRRIKSKIHLHTNKKSCEILTAVADKIKLQLHDVDSQIQEDMGQFIGASKSKRKRLESRFEEHQERLKSIHEKFKEEVNHHLLNYSNTLAELEAKNLEMKGTADRQKVLHKKLLLQSEEAMKDELTAAERSITTIRKDARKKLNSLKFALEEWLGE